MRQNRRRIYLTSRESLDRKDESFQPVRLPSLNALRVCRRDCESVREWARDSTEIVSRFLWFTSSTTTWMQQMPHAMLDDHDDIIQSAPRRFFETRIASGLNATKVLMSSGCLNWWYTAFQFHDVTVHGKTLSDVGIKVMNVTKSVKWWSWSTITASLDLSTLTLNEAVKSRRWGETVIMSAVMSIADLAVTCSHNFRQRD